MPAYDDIYWHAAADYILIDSGDGYRTYSQLPYYAQYAYSACYSTSSSCRQPLFAKNDLVMIKPSPEESIGRQVWRIYDVMSHGGAVLYCLRRKNNLLELVHTAESNEDNLILVKRNKQ